MSGLKETASIMKKYGAFRENHIRILICEDYLTFFTPHGQCTITEQITSCKEDPVLNCIAMKLEVSIDDILIVISKFDYFFNLKLDVQENKPECDEAV